MTMSLTRPAIPEVAGAGQDLPARGRYRLRSLLRGPAWPVTALTIGYPLWWALGLGALVFPIAAVPMAMGLRKLRHINVPPWFGLWLLFDGGLGHRWVAVGVTAAVAVATAAATAAAFVRNRREHPQARIVSGRQCNRLVGATDNVRRIHRSKGK